MPASSGTPPLLVLGMDAGDARWIRRWVGEGRLPTIGALLEEGCHGTLDGPEMAFEIGTGLTLFSGVSRTVHGHYDYRQLDPGTYDLVPAAAGSSGPPPFWAAMEGGRVVVVDPFETRVQPGLDGTQLTHWTAHQPGYPGLPTEAEPPELLDRLGRGPDVLADWVAGARVDQDRRALERLLKRIERKGALCREMLDEGVPDVGVFMFSDMHVAAHRFWNYRPDAGGSAARPGDPVLTHAIRDVYEAIDREFGRILDRFPDDTNVAFAAMFGMKDHLPTTNLPEAILRTLGYQAAPGGSGAEPGGLIALARRILPAFVREWLGRRLSLDAQHRIIARHLEEQTDWSRTTVFPIWSLFDSYFRVNLRGREPEGIIAPDEYRELLDRLRNDLEALVDPVTGETAVDEVMLHHELFGEPADRLPDLIVRWKPHTHLLTRLVHPRGEIAPPELGYRRESFHRMEGMVALRGPDVTARGDLGVLDPLGMAPTCLGLLGRRVPETMSGRAWPMGAALRR